MSKTMHTLLARYKSRLAGNMGLQEQNDIIIGWLEKYISENK